MEIWKSDLAGPRIDVAHPCIDFVVPRTICNGLTDRQGVPGIFSWNVVAFLIDQLYVDPSLLDRRPYDEPLRTALARMIHAPPMMAQTTALTSPQNARKNMKASSIDSVITLPSLVFTGRRR